MLEKCILKVLARAVSFPTTEKAQKSVASYLMLSLQLLAHSVDCVLAVNGWVVDPVVFLLTGGAAPFSEASLIPVAVKCKF